MSKMDLTKQSKQIAEWKNRLERSGWTILEVDREFKDKGLGTEQKMRDWKDRLTKFQNDLDKIERKY